ncbi:MAG: sensor histidine kinase, partial [Paludibacteraceae bacterium]
FEAIKRENEVRQNFTTKLLESQEAERNRIALGLHDSVGQNLLLIKNHLLSKIKQSSVQNDLAVLNEIGDLADETIQEIRNITYNLRPQYLDQLGLTAAIETIAEKISESSGINISLDIEDKIDDLISKNDQINFFRIVQESLNNIVKHSGADEAFVIMKRENDQILLEIRDNGKGFQNINIVSGTGITGMRERAKILGTGLDIIHDESGTKIKMIYPIKAVLQNEV